VVATGTGSGKTEAFLMPIIDHCVRVAALDTLKAILINPMNALANDQRGRIRKLLAGTSVSFAVYTGETRQWGQRPEGIPAYLPSVLAEAGPLPGYAFPGDPGSLSLGLDADVVFAGRLQAQREFCTGQMVYARGHRWTVRGLALHRPGALGTGRGAEKFAYTECPVCGLAQASNNNCRRCDAELAAANLEAWDAAAFQSWLEEVEPDSEEERQQGSYDVPPHPQQDVGTQAWAVGDWRLELRRQEQIWWINHGPMGLPSDGDGDSNGNGTRPEGFRMSRLRRHCAIGRTAAARSRCSAARPEAGARSTRRSGSAREAVPWRAKIGDFGSAG
jgi:hypothetical protein